MKSNNTSVIVRFVIFLVVSLSLVFLGHQTFLIAPSIDSLKQAYLFNGVFTAAMFLALVSIRKTFKESLGFVFLGTSTLKFIFFFIFFYPTMRGDGVIDKEEFLVFFIPYAISLTLEIYFLVRVLMKD